ncbi:MAG: acetyl-CoA carboxylase biotin carboxyl carrier protein subunit [Ignavibacteria bacterium]
MITKIEIKNYLKEFLIKNEELREFNNSVKIKQLSKNYFLCTKDRQIFELIIDKDESDNILLYYKGQIFVIKPSTILFENNLINQDKVQSNFVVKSPMPGLVSKILVNVGDKVGKGTGLLKIEAMKMENEIKSPVAGIVESVKINHGIVVEKNAPLVVIKIQN